MNKRYHGFSGFQTVGVDFKNQWEHIKGIE